MKTQLAVFHGLSKIQINQSHLSITHLNIHSMAPHINKLKVFLSAKNYAAIEISTAQNNYNQSLLKY